MSLPPRTTNAFELAHEREDQRGWVYDVVLSRGSASTRHQITLSYADHDHMTGGAVPPSRALETILSWLLDEHPEHVWPARFDASTIRRRFPDMDETLGRRL